jgi:hypothetical protein
MNFKHAIPMALTGLLATSAALATECRDEPRFFTGTATAHALSGLEIRELTLEVVIERISETECQTTTTITAVDDPGVTDTVVCIDTQITEAGASLVSCDDGSFGSKVNIGSNSARRLQQPDGTINVSGSAVDDGGERRRNITTRLGPNGQTLGYVREQLVEVEGSE